MSTKKEGQYFITTVVIPQITETQQPDTSSGKEQMADLIISEINNRIHDKINQTIKRKMK